MERNRMANSNQKDLFQYDLIAKLLHWFLALLLISMLGLGWYMVSIGLEPRSDWYFSLHKSLGILAGVLILFRLFWRFTHKPGPYSARIALWQVHAAKMLHWLLYVLMILMPLTGFIGSSLNKYGVAFFGIPISLGLDINIEASNQLLTLHGYLAWALLTLIILHLLAALKHLIINRDNVFRRMWF